PTLLALSFISYTLINLAPGDPAQVYLEQHLGVTPTPGEVTHLRHQWGLEHPLLVRYGDWLGDAVQGNLGRSFYTGNSVVSDIGSRVTRTLSLAIPAALLAILLGIPAGVVAAVRRGKLADHLIRLGALGGASFPSFLVGLAFIDIFAVRFHFFPAIGQGGLSSYVLPVVTLSLGPAAILCRLMRASYLETISQDYIRTARAKGLRKWRVIIRHALPNASIVVITALGTIVAGLMLGAVVVETVFGWAGLGQLTIEAIYDRDYPIVQGLMVLAGSVFLLANLAVDVSYHLIDPRVRLGARAR
ncbi:MAG: ABC transporter permease, partial [Acidimicrobiales bacterium]